MTTEQRPPAHRTGPDDTPPEPPDGAPLRRADLRPRRSRRARLLISAACVVALVLVTVIGYGLYVYLSIDKGVRRSAALGQGQADAAPSTDTDLLIMGLDSRLDADGKPLPAALYKALHTGDSSIGGFNSNVLMYIHIPADGSKATGIAIPRDDYVDVPDCPSGVCRAKIKEAYGLAFNQKMQELARAGVTGETAHQEARDAGRAQEVATVEQFLGVRINHFVEVTMVGFFQVAEVVQPITVCLKHDTQDRFSGANFKAGKQQINAKQAMAFVRQRRDNVHPDLLFTDLDRSRRQQAFIVSLFLQLKQTGTLLNPAKLTSLVDVAKQNIVVDEGLSPIQLATLGSKMSGGNIHFYTLPVKAFGSDPHGASINIVDPVEIKAIVQRLMHPKAAAASKPTPTPSPPSLESSLARATTVSVLNGSGRAGAARSLMGWLERQQFVAGEVGNRGSLTTSRIEYGPGSEAVADQLAALLGGIPTQPASSLQADRVQVLIGSDLKIGADGTATRATPTPTPAPTTQDPVSATGGGRGGPPPTALTDLSGSSGIPCVK